MAADFEISSLSGTGTATIRVKPKAVNEDMNNIKEQARDCHTACTDQSYCFMPAKNKGFN